MCHIVSKKLTTGCLAVILLLSSPRAFSYVVFWKLQFSHLSYHFLKWWVTWKMVILRHIYLKRKSKTLLYADISLEVVNMISG
jgi:hypothetical protein